MGEMEITIGSQINLSRVHRLWLWRFRRGHITAVQAVHGAALRMN
jgi:hypothetical protein